MIILDNDPVRETNPQHVPYFLYPIIYKPVPGTMIATTAAKHDANHIVHFKNHRYRINHVLRG
jgi:hypothetical protein